MESPRRAQVAAACGRCPVCNGRMVGQTEVIPLLTPSSVVSFRIARHFDLVAENSLTKHYEPP